MWTRVCIGLLVLAMIASGATASPAHLHIGNGHRVAHDDHHAGNPAQPLWHSHGAPHAHDADAHLHEPAAPSPGDTGDEPQEDVLSVGGIVPASPTAHLVPPVLVAILVAWATLDVPVRASRASVGALPPVHAPPLIAPRSPRAPPTSRRLLV